MKNKYLLQIIKSFFIILVLLFNLSACSKVDVDFLEKMKKINGDGDSSSEFENEDWSKDLEKDIKYFSKILNEKVDAGEKLGTYYKMMGLKYLDFSMYQLALESFEKALEIYPENSIVLYNAGLTSARLSKTKASLSESKILLDEAKRYYQASLTINNRFSSPMYGLAILYVYELDEPKKAIPLLETYNTIQKSSMNGRFLLAYALFAAGDQSGALEVYDFIIDKGSIGIEIEAAKNNRNDILRGEYNGQ